MSTSRMVSSHDFARDRQTDPFQELSTPLPFPFLVIMAFLVLILKQLKKPSPM